MALRDRAGGIVSGIMDYLGQTGDEQILSGWGRLRFLASFRETLQWHKILLLGL